MWPVVSWGLREEIGECPAGRFCERNALASHFARENEKKGFDGKKSGSGGERSQSLRGRAGGSMNR